LPFLGQLGFFWILNAGWAFSNITPIIMTQQYAVKSKNYENKEKLDTLDYVLGGIWCLLFVMETVADNQKYKFRNNPQNADKFMKNGFWKFCRFPNYFAEIGMWTCVFLLAIRELPLNQLWVINSPLIAFTLLRYLSGIPLLEKSYQQRFGNNPQYINYVNNTNLLLPWFPKNQ